jgi:hypothetical protein
MSMRTEPPDGPGSAAEGVCAFLAGLGVGRTSAIHLVGRRALAPLLWLCRHGFDEVTVLTAARSPSEPADLLVSLDTCGVAAFERLAGDLPHVKPGGLVIVRTDRRRRTDRDRARRLLGRDGFRIERQLRHGRRDVYVARREVATAATSVAAAR